MEIKKIICLIIALVCVFAMAACGSDNGSNKGDDDDKDVCTHAEVTTTARVEPTCTKDGKSEGKTCATCNAVIVKATVIPATGHTIVALPGVESTCASVGKTDGKECSVCKEILVPQSDINVKAHTPVLDAEVKATCTTDGKTAGAHCSVCGKVLTAPVTVPKGHTEVVLPAVNAECAKEGKTEGKQCSVCETVTVAQQTLPALEHKDEDRNGICDVCNFIIDKEDGGATENKTAIEEFIDLVMSSAPTSIKTLTYTTVGTDILEGEFITTINGQNSVTVYTFERYAIPGVDESDTAIMEISGKIYYTDGKYSEDGVNFGTYAPHPGALQIKFNLSKENLGSKYTLRNGKLTLNLTAAEAAELLGISITDASSKIKVVVDVNSIYLTGVDVEYTKTDGTKVSLKTSYTYNPVVTE